MVEMIVTGVFSLVGFFTGAFVALLGVAAGIRKEKTNNE